MRFRTGRDRYDEHGENVEPRIVLGEVIDLGTVRRPGAGPDTRPDTLSDNASGRPDTGAGRSADMGPDTGADADPDQSGVDTDTAADTGADTGSDVAVSGAGLERTRFGAAGPSGVEIVPSWLRSREAFTGAASEAAGYAGRWAAFHLLRLPVYWARLTLRSRRTLWRVIVFVFNWTTDVNGRLVRRSVAYMPSLGANEAHAFHRVSEQHRERVKFRLLFVLVLALAVVPAAVVAWLRVPGWQLAAAAAVVLPVLGLADRGPDRRPVVDSFAAADTHAPRVSIELVTAALSALGIGELNRALRAGAEALRFVAPGVHRDGPGWRVDVDLPGGVTAGDVAERRDRLASGLRRPLACVWPETDHDAHPGRLVLWVGDKAPSKAKPKPWPLADKGRVSLFDEFPIGVDFRGRPVTISLMFASMVIGAIPRMGKSFTLRLVLLAAALDHLAELHVFDLKGGVDLRPLGVVAHRFRSGDADEDLAYVRDDLADLKAEMSRRYEVLRSLPETRCPEGRVTPELAADPALGLHPIVVALDECHFLFDHPVFGADAVDACSDLVRRGPAVGIIAILATQRPDATSIPKAISANAVLRFCLKVTEQTANDMVLGQSMYKAGVRATMFARTDKGTGYLVGEGADPQIVQTAYLDGIGAKTVAARARTYRAAAGTITGYAAGLDLDTTPVDSSTVVDDLLHVMPASEPKVWSDVLIDRLATYKPDVYTGWTATDLGNALTPYGVETIQLGRRIDGKVINRKGVDRSDLAAALDRIDTTRAQATGTTTATGTERDERTPAWGTPEAAKGPAGRTAPAPRRAPDDDPGGHCQHAPESTQGCQPGNPDAGVGAASQDDEAPADDPGDATSDDGAEDAASVSDRSEPRV